MNAINVIDSSSTPHIEGLFPNFHTAATVLRKARAAGQLTASLPDEEKSISSFFSLLDIVEASFAWKPPKRPFIVVIEGLDGTGKTTLVQSLQTEFRQRHPSYTVSAVGTPPLSLSSVRKFFDTCDSLVTRAYYMLTNYVLQYEMFQTAAKTEHQCIFFVDRFYSSTCAYSVGWKNTSGDETSVDALPQQVFDWPKDLGIPDLIVILRIDDAVRRSRVVKRGELNNGNPWDGRLFKDLNLGRRMMRALVRGAGTGHSVVIDANKSKKEVLHSVAESVTIALERLRNPLECFRVQPLQYFCYEAVRNGLCDWSTGLRVKHMLWYMQIATNCIGNKTMPPILKIVGIHKVDDGGIVFFACKFPDCGEVRGNRLRGCSIVSVSGEYPDERQWRAEGFFVEVSQKEAALLSLSLLPSLVAYVSASAHFEQTKGLDSVLAAGAARLATPENYNEVVDQMRKTTSAENLLESLTCYRFVPMRFELLTGTPSSQQKRMRRHEWQRDRQQGWTESRCILPFSTSTVLPISLRDPCMPITLAITGTHCAGKATIGKELARILGWKFDGELGDSLREKEKLIAGGHKSGDGTESQKEQKGKWDDIVFGAERDRDEKSEGCRVVETWHIGNLAWALFRGLDAANRKRLRELAWSNLQSELSHSCVLWVHLKISPQVSARRHALEENARRLPMEEGRVEEEIEALHRELDVGVAKILNEFEDLKIPVLEVNNLEDGPEAIMKIVRSIVEFVNANLWRVAVE